MSEKLKPCPLCRRDDGLEIQNDGVYKPEIICTNCGISLQRETVEEVVKRWNERIDNFDNEK